MGTSYEGFALHIQFEKAARASAWRRGRLAVAQRPVQAVIDELKARPLSDASIFSNPVEVSVAVTASEIAELESLLEALVISAAEKGAHAEFARFPLEGAVSCRVWSARKRQLVERPPESRDVKRDYKLAQRELREVVRRKARREAAPPSGLKPLQAWAVPLIRRTKPTLPCPECRASMKPKAVLDVPQLGPKLGPRMIQVYECDACAAEEPTVEHVHITLGPGGASKQSSPKAFLDYPETDEAARERPSPRSGGIQLGGYPHGHYSEDPRISISCRHPPTLLQLEPSALGMRIPKVRVATSLCLNPGCKRPGVAEPVTY